MRFLLGLLLSFVVASAVGLGATLFSLTRDTTFNDFRIGAWTAWPKTGTNEIDPYSLAIFARIGTLPVGVGDGIAFIAQTDDEGRPLDGRCDVVVSGLTPQARFWTITLYNREGDLAGNAIGRSGFTSQEVMRKADGSFDIFVAPRARAGNWLPTGNIGHYMLALRLYDTPVGVASRTGKETQMPSIKMGACP